MNISQDAAALLSEPVRLASLAARPASDQGLALPVHARPCRPDFYVVRPRPASGRRVQPFRVNRFAAAGSRGYAPAGASSLATLLVRLDYGVDEGRREYTENPLARSRMPMAASATPSTAHIAIRSAIRARPVLR